MNISYTENKSGIPSDVFPLREELSNETERSESDDIRNNNINSVNDFPKNTYKKNIFSDILSDKENAVIIILIIILLKNSADKKIILALCYLLI